MILLLPCVLIGVLVVLVPVSAAVFRHHAGSNSRLYKGFLCKALGKAYCVCDSFDVFCGCLHEMVYLTHYWTKRNGVTTWWCVPNQIEGEQTNDFSCVDNTPRGQSDNSASLVSNE